MRAVNISLVATFGCLLLAPMTAQFAGREPGQPLKENRTLAKPAAFPNNWEEAVRIPAETDEYVRDHFGLRRWALRTHDKLIWYVLGDSPSVQVTRGRQGVLFFNSHGANNPYSLFEQSCGIGLPAAAIAAVTADVTKFLKVARQINPNSELVIVPTKAPIYPELLPRWLGERCKTAVPPAAVLGQSLIGQPQLAAMMDYPLDEMRALKASIVVYPPQAFHWAGDMPRLMAQRISEKTFGLAKSSTPSRPRNRASFRLAGLRPRRRSFGGRPSARLCGRRRSFVYWAFMLSRTWQIRRTSSRRQSFSIGRRIRQKAFAHLRFFWSRDRGMVFAILLPGVASQYQLPHKRFDG